MKKLILFLLLSIVFLNSKAQNNQSSNLIGVQTKDSFKQPPYSQWFDTNYNNYTFDEATVKKIKKHLKGITIKAFMGTWCGDSKREIPSLYKLLDAANFDYKNLTMIAVDRSKSTPDNLQEGLNITNVPTFIFNKKGKEIGRFVEYPRETLEKDILKIVSGQPYKHSYQD